MCVDWTILRTIGGKKYEDKDNGNHIENIEVVSVQ